MTNNGSFDRKKNPRGWESSMRDVKFRSKARRMKHRISDIEAAINLPFGAAGCSTNTVIT
jgi:hypothetical protein